MKRMFLGWVAAVLLTGPLQAQGVLGDWNSLSVPARPDPSAVTIEPATTALLMLDFMRQNCAVRPRCVASLPSVQGLLARARGSGMLVVYSFIANTTAADVLPDVRPLDSEQSVRAGPNKFIGTELAELLRARRIQTVIIVGTAANGAVLATGSHAAYTGLNVIVPIDGMSAERPFDELYTAWHFRAAPGVAPRSTLTTIDAVRF